MFFCLAFLSSNVLLQAEVFYMFLFAMLIISLDAEFLSKKGYFTTFVSE